MSDFVYYSPYLLMLLFHLMAFGAICTRYAKDDTKSEAFLMFWLAAFVLFLAIMIGPALLRVIWS